MSALPADLGTAARLGAALAGGYLLGSIPFGLILTRLAGLGDIRAIGSGNIGATNVLRTGHKGLAALTLVLDAGKGAAAVLAAGLIAPEAAAVAGLGAVLGHLFPVWLRFRGGKGVATALGVLAAAHWPVGAGAAAVWVLVAVVSRYSSLAAILALLAAPVAAWTTADTATALLATAVALLVIAKHRENIARLVAGTEPRIGEGA